MKAVDPIFTTYNDNHSKFLSEHDIIASRIDNVMIMVTYDKDNEVKVHPYLMVGYTPENVHLIDLENRAYPIKFFYNEKVVETISDTYYYKNLYNDEKPFYNHYIHKIFDYFDKQLTDDAINITASNMQALLARRKIKGLNKQTLKECKTLKEDFNILYKGKRIGDGQLDVICDKIRKMAQAVLDYNIEKEKIEKDINSKVSFKQKLKEKKQSIIGKTKDKENLQTPEDAGTIVIEENVKQ